MLTTVLVASLVTIGPQAKMDLRTTLCIDKFGSPISTKAPACLRSGESGDFEIPKELHEAAFVLKEETSELISLRLGRIHPGEQMLPSEESYGKVGLQIQLLNDRHETETLQLSISDPTRTWRVSLGPEEFRKLRLLMLEPGIYSLSFEAAYHLGARRERLNIEQGKLLELRQVHLPPLPRVTGQIIDVSGAVISGAAILDPSGKSLATSDNSGGFDVELRTAANYLQIDHPDFAPVDLPIDPKRLNERRVIRLTRGGKLIMTVDGLALTAAQEAEVVLLRDLSRARGQEIAPYKEIAHGRVTPDRDRISFDRIPAGDYFVSLKGKKPFQQVTQQLVIEDAQITEGSLLITPKPILITVFLGEDPLANATITARQANKPWEARITTDHEGAAQFETWQFGWFTVALSASGFAQPYRSSIRIAPDDAGAFTIQIPQRRIVGTVSDCETGTPVTDSTVLVEILASETSLKFSVPVDKLGRFEVTTVPEGVHRLQAESPAYPVSEPVEVRVGAADGDQRINLRLCPSDIVTIQVIDQSASPMPAALVLETWSNRIQKVDAGGIAKFPLSAEGRENAQFFVFSPGQSFTFASLDRRDAESLTVTMPDGLSSLLLRAATRDGKPLEGAIAIFRYEGNFLPSSVRGLFEQYWQTRLRTDKAGTLNLKNLPAGRYEFWIGQTPSDLAKMIHLKQADVIFDLPVGSAEVKLVFDPRN